MIVIYLKLKVQQNKNLLPKSYFSGTRNIYGVDYTQNADGSITIPEALRPYMGGKEVILPRK